MDDKEMSQISAFMMEELDKIGEHEVSLKHDVKNIQRNLKDGGGFICEMNDTKDQIIGILEYKITGPEGRVCLLKRTFVNEKYRGQGLSLVLKKKLESIITQLGVHRIITQVKNSNIVSIKMNLKMGYSLVENDEVLRDSADAKWYEKRISSKK